MELDQKTKEEELQAKIDEMRDSISKGKSPDFKKFWQAKKDCLNLFKGELNPYARFEFWKEYLEISQEAKKLKKILDQESDFSKEQLEKALESLEKDIENFTVLLEDQEEVFPKIDILEREEYSPLQKEISLLNIFGQRIVSLRKELLDLKIRVGIKSKLFKKLSLVGNKIFPRKKELTQKISEKFKKDIDIFIEENSSLKKIPFYILKSKIQSLQAIAKILLLDTKTFTATRIALSKLWDKIKSFENQGKEKNFEKILKKVEEFSKNCKRCSLKEAEKHKKNLLHLLKRTALPKEEVDVLKEEIAKAMKDILEEEEKREQKQKKE